MEEKANKNKKIILIIVIVVLVILVMAAIGGVCYYNYLINIEKEKQSEIYTKNSEALMDITENIEYGASLTYEELLSKLVKKDELFENTEIKIEINDREITQEETYKFEEVGSYKIKTTLHRNYEYKIAIKEFKEVVENIKEMNVTVLDTKPPVITGVTNKEITVGEDINLLEGITATDEVDGNIEIKTEGEVDKNKPGEYTIKVRAKDRNGNEAEQEYKVTVKEKKEEKPQQTTTAKDNSSSNSSSSNNTNNNNTSSSNKGNATTTTSNSNSSSSNDSSTKNGRLAIAKTEAKKVVGQIIKAGMSDYAKAEAIFKYLHNNVALQDNQSNEAYKTNYGNEAYAALILKKAACSGFCKAVTLMCDAAGLKSQHINANKWIHQWNKVYVGGEWIILDAQGGFFGGTEHPFADLFE